MGNFLNLLLRRLAALPVMILGIPAMVFIIMKLAPGDEAPTHWAKAPQKRPKKPTAQNAD